jgi:hypothetical protein
VLSFSDVDVTSATNMQRLLTYSHLLSFLNLNLFLKYILGSSNSAKTLSVCINFQYTKGFSSGESTA